MKRLGAFLFTAVLCAAAHGAEYARLPGGRFDSVLPQGPASSPATPVDIEPFELRKTPVTVGEFAAFVEAHPEWRRDRVPLLFAERGYLSSWSTPTQPPGDTLRSAPIVNVSWFAAKAFCETEGARLPTWLEWEVAAAADEISIDARRDPAWRRRILAWYERPAASRIPSVGGSANAYGVSNLHGLVWEWVDDFNALFIAGDSRTQGDPDLLKFCGSGAISIIDRDSYAVLMRIALLSSLAAAGTTSTLGFRCARSLGAPQ